MNNQTHFFQYLFLIKKEARRHQSKWKNVPYEEIELQGILIYVDALRLYDKNKGSFSTFLTWRLAKLKDFCVQYSKQIDKTFTTLEVENDIYNFQDLIVGHKKNPSLTQLLEYSYPELSKNAYKVLKWILERNWEKQNRKKPSILLASQIFNTNRKEMEQIWKEISDFFKKDPVFH